MSNQNRKRAINRAVKTLLRSEGMITIENIRVIANTFLKSEEQMNRTQTKRLLAEMIEKGSK